MSQVSVIIPSYNAHAFIEQCVDSVLTQTHHVAQIIIIDNSPREGIRELLADRIASHPNQLELVRVEPCNVSQARNIGLTKARHELIAYLDADDIWMPDKIERQVKLLEEDTEAAGSHTRLFLFRDDPDDEGRREWDRIEDDPSLERILMWQAVPASTVLVRRRLLDDIEFTPESGHGEDTIWAADLRLKGRWRCVDAPVTGRRLHESQVTKSAWHTIHNTETRVKWVRQVTDKIGADEAQRLEDMLWNQLISFIERRYWRRQFDDFHAMRDRIRELTPDYLERSFVNRKRILPRWLYALADRLKPRAAP